MMNENEKNLYFYNLRQKIIQSTESEEVVQLIREITPLLSAEDTSSDAYDLLPSALQALREFTQENATEGERLIFAYLFPYLVRDGDTHVSILSAIGRLRDCLVDWFDQYPEPERSALRGRVLDQLLLQL